METFKFHNSLISRQLINVSSPRQRSQVAIEISYEN